MLKLDIGATEAYDEAIEQFVTMPGTIVELEHSLFSLSKWEAFYEKPFLSANSTMTMEETVEYIKMMAVDPDVPPEIFDNLTNKNLQTVNDYITAKMTATFFNDMPGPSVRSQEAITSEIMYYWLVALTIPFDPVQHWHLNRMLALVKVCNIKNQPQKKKTSFTRSDLDARRNLNAQRRAKAGTAG